MRHRVQRLRRPQEVMGRLGKPFRGEHWIRKRWGPGKMAGTDSGFGIGLNYTGLKDLIVVHTPDATPAADKRDEESVRKLIWLPPIWLTCLRQQEMELL